MSKGHAAYVNHNVVLFNWWLVSIQSTASQHHPSCVTKPMKTTVFLLLRLCIQLISPKTDEVYEAKDIHEIHKRLKNMNSSNLLTVLICECCFICSLQLNHRVLLVPCSLLTSLVSFWSGNCTRTGVYLTSRRQIPSQEILSPLALAPPRTRTLQDHQYMICYVILTVDFVWMAVLCTASTVLIEMWPLWGQRWQRRSSDWDEALRHCGVERCLPCLITLAIFCR